MNDFTGSAASQADFIGYLHSEVKSAILPQNANSRKNKNLSIIESLISD